MNPVPDEAAPRPEQRVGDTLLSSAAYVTVALGYLTSVLLSGAGSIPGFIVLTLANLGWVYCCWRLVIHPEHSGRFVSRMTLALLVLTLAALAAPWLGIALDWLLPVVTVSVVTIFFPWRQALALAAGVWLATALDIFALDGTGAHVNYAYLVQNQLSIGVAFAFVFAFSLVFSLEMDQRARAEALVTQLEAAQMQLRASASAAEELAITRERNRMAREIHDTLGHYLTILSVKLETAIKLEAHADVRLGQELVEARRVATECLAEVRRSVAALRPTDPSASLLSEALQRLVSEFEGTVHAVEIALDIVGPVEELSPELRVALYRCAQEALTNIRKHARATKVLVRLRVDARQTELAVLDNGLGPDDNADGSTHERQHGFGLLGMRERIALLGGTARAGAEPGRGWRVEVIVPLRGVAGEHTDEHTDEARLTSRSPAAVEG